MLAVLRIMHIDIQADLRINPMIRACVRYQPAVGVKERPQGMTIETRLCGGSGYI